MPKLRNLVSAERRALAEDLAGLAEAQWNSPSLCTGWTVRDVVAHLCAIASLHAPRLVLGLAKSRLSFADFANTEIQRHLGADTAATLAEFCALRDRRKTPWLGEMVVHGADIRRPLGITHDYSPGAVRRVIDFYKGTNILIGAKNRIAGLALHATDEDWSHGDGQPVEGPLLSLLLAITGRRAGCDDLTGPGVETLCGRCGLTDRRHRR